MYTFWVREEVGVLRNSQAGAGPSRVPKGTSVGGVYDPGVMASRLLSCPWTILLQWLVVGERPSPVAC
jgi:hypothetical protein